MTIYPREIAGRFDPSSLKGQFIVCRNQEFVPDGWEVHDLGGSWWLGLNELPVVRVVDEAGVQTGWLLGTAVDPIECRVLTEEIGQSDLLGRLDYLSGRFVAILPLYGLGKVFLDPAGSLSLVYAPDDSIIASSLMLVPYSSRTRDDDDLIETLGIPERNGVYPFGLTPRRGVRRLLPNFALDITTWEATRCWGRAFDHLDDLSAVAVRSFKSLHRLSTLWLRRACVCADYSRARFPMPGRV